MNKRISNQIFGLFMLMPAFLFLPVGEVVGQVKAGQAKNRSGMGVQTATGNKDKKRAVPEYRISGIIISPDGQPVVNALIYANEGAITMRSDMNGSFRLTVRLGSFLRIEAEGFEPVDYEIIYESEDIKIVLATAPFYSGYDDIVRLPLNIREKQRYIVGAVSGTSDEKLATYPELLVGNTLSGQIPGLYAQMTVNDWGNNNANLFVRGLGRNVDNGAIVLIDGVERNIDMLLLEEIESVDVMKDAASKILYGSRAANGIVSVTTKRGKMHTRKITGAYQQGVGLPKAYPAYLNSYQYAMMYNEARQNDGLPPMYTPADLEGYRNSSGPNDMRYPDVDYLDYFLNKTSDFRKATVEFSGGNENARYAFVAGYNGNTGLQKIGEPPKRDRFNIRGNLDMKINDFIKAFAGIAGIFDINKRSSLNHANTFDRISNTRPNEFPLIIDRKYVPTDSLGFPGLGASFDRDNNLYGALMYGGNFRENSVNGQLNLGLDFDLSNWTKGLSAKVQFGFDNFFTGAESLGGSVATYAQRWNYDATQGKDTVKLYQLSQTIPSTQRSLVSSHNLRGTTYLLGLDYERTFNNLHRFSANMRYHYTMYEQTGETSDLQNANTALRVNYSFSDKYIVELDLALMGSNVFPKENRHFLSYAGGLGWIISEEDFLRNANAINYLKVKTSAGLLGYDGATDMNLYFNRWGEGVYYQVRQGNNIPITELHNWASPRLRWEKSGEFNIGFEGLFLNRKLWVESDYFNELRFDIITGADSEYSAVYGSLFGQKNIEKVHNQGIEFELKYMSNAGKFFYSVGFNGMWSKNKLLATNDVSHASEDRSLAGKPTDITLGYVALGLFGKDVPLEGAPFQTFGYYTTGDIAYKDLNNDDIIDENDRKAIGNSFPRFNFGMPVDISWKGFGVNILGVAGLGIQDVVSNGYFWNSGNNKWSDMTLNRYHPDNNPGGTYPRLTTTQGGNNFVNSTFWLHRLDFFRIKNAEASYTFGYDQPLTPWLKTAKVFLRGTNILTISKFKVSDPEVPNAGLSNYPLFSVYSAGLSVSF
jgi:TonB-linked SusC/RagA family outer membrane protein